MNCVENTVKPTSRIPHHCAVTSKKILIIKTKFWTTVIKMETHKILLMNNGAVYNMWRYKGVNADFSGL